RDPAHCLQGSEWNSDDAVRPKCRGNADGEADRCACPWNSCMGPAEPACGRKPSALRDGVAGRRSTWRSGVRYVLLFVSRAEGRRRREGQFDRQWILCGVGEQPTTALDRDSRTARSGCAGLERKCARPANDGARSFRCCGVACGAATRIPGAAVSQVGRREALMSIATENDTTITRRRLFM